MKQLIHGIVLIARFVDLIDDYTSQSQVKSSLYTEFINLSRAIENIKTLSDVYLIVETKAFRLSHGQSHIAMIR